MPDVTYTSRAEAAAEAELRKWYAHAALGSPDTLDAAARTLQGLITALLGTLFAVLALAADPLPLYLKLCSVKVLGTVAIVGLLVSLAFSLGVVFPRHFATPRSRPDEQRRDFAVLLGNKRRWLMVSIGAFALALAALSAVLIIALWATPQ